MGNNNNTINLPTMGEDTTGMIFESYAMDGNYSPSSVQVNENTKFSDDDEINDIAHTFISLVNETHDQGEPIDDGDVEIAVVRMLENDRLSGLSDSELDNLADYLLDETNFQNGLDALIGSDAIVRPTPNGSTRYGNMHYNSELNENFNQDNTHIQNILRRVNG